MIIDIGSSSALLDSFGKVGACLYPNDKFFRDGSSQLANRNVTLFVAPKRGRLAAFLPDLRWNEKQVGIIGYYECENDRESARALIDAAEAWLAAQGANFVIGPMDGSTWHKYRFKTAGTTNYFLDHYHKSWYPEQFVDLGFEAIAHYYSTSQSLDASPDPGELEHVAIREFNTTSKDEDLQTIYRLSIEGFHDNFLFTPIAQPEFLAMYQPIVPLVDPRLVVFAEEAGKTIAFAFAIPDQLDRTRVVVKSAAVLPEYRSIGIGSLMIRTIQATARKLGYKTVIHAFMHENNISRRIATADAKIIAEYALYAKPIS